MRRKTRLPANDTDYEWIQRYGRGILFLWYEQDGLSVRNLIECGCGALFLLTYPTSNSLSFVPFFYFSLAMCKDGGHLLWVWLCIVLAFLFLGWRRCPIMWFPNEGKDECECGMVVDRHEIVLNKSSWTSPSRWGEVIDGSLVCGCSVLSNLDKLLTFDT